MPVPEKVTLQPLFFIDLSMTTSLKDLKPFVYEFFHHSSVIKCGDITQFINLTFCDFSQDPPHDLAAPGLG